MVQEGQRLHGVPSGPSPASAPLAPPVLPLADVPVTIRANRQTTDILNGRLLAEGDAEVEVAGGLLLADRMEYVFATKTLVATGAVRFIRGAHHVQASAFRYDFVRQEGELKDAYGIISFDTLAEDLDFRSPAPGRKMLPGDVAAAQRHGHLQEPEPQQRLPPACPPATPDEALARCLHPGRGRDALQRLDDLLNRVAFSSPSSRPEAEQNPLPEGDRTRQPLASTAEQRVNGIKAKQGLQLIRIKRRIGDDDLVTAPDGDRDPAVPLPLQQLGGSSVALLDGQINRWRFQARRLTIAPEVLTSPRIALTNDPLTPAQLVIEGVRTTIAERSDGEVEIISATHRVLLDGKLTVPVPNRILLRKNRKSRFRWSLQDDQENRDGLYIERTLDTRSFLGGELTLKPQFMLDRALSGSTAAYPPARLPVGDDPVGRSTAAADLLGLDLRYVRPLGPQREGQLSLQADLSTLVPDHFAEATRGELKIAHPLRVPGIGDITANISAAYRFSVWNGSLSYQDVYTAFGGFLEQTRDLGRWGGLENQLFWRLGAQNINATIFDTSDLSGKTWRASGYVRLTSTLQAWEGKRLQDPQAALRYSQIPVHPGLRISFHSIGQSIRYGDGNGQTTYTFSVIPTLTLGRLSRRYLDHTQLAIGGSVSVVDRLSPYAFDRAVDLGILHASLKQQIVGPLILSLDLSYNIDRGSENYGKRVDSLFQLKWQRRVYELSAFYAPERKVGGLQIRLNDFDWSGTGIPFMP